MQRHPRDEALSWLGQAEADFISADWCLEGSRFDTVCFLSQQSAEKALKAVLLLCNGSKARTHVLTDLIKELTLIDSRYGEELGDVSALDVFYTASRYPDAIGGAIPAATFKLKEAELALERANIAVQFAKRVVLSEA